MSVLSHGEENRLEPFIGTLTVHTEGQKSHISKQFENYVYHKTGRLKGAARALRLRLHALSLTSLMVSLNQRERKTIPLHPMRTMALRASQKASSKPLQLSVLLSTVDTLLTVRARKARANVPKPTKGKLRTTEFE